MSGTTTEPTTNPLLALMHRLEGDARLDPLVERLRGVSDRVLAAPSVRSVLRGEPIGHSLHSPMTDAPIGLWSASALLDLTGPRRFAGASDRLVGLGVLAALPTAAAGLADWSTTREPSRRVGAVHAMLNSAALCCYATSWTARRRGRRGLGVATSMLGAGLMGAGGYLGGHMALERKEPPSIEDGSRAG